MASSIGKMKSVSTAEDEPMFQLCLREIQEMSEMRFIEKICRPIKKEDKQKIYTDFHLRFLRLHQRLDHILKDCSQMSHSSKSKRTGPDESSIKMIKQMTERVEQAYKQLFLNGSFKNYVRIAVIVGLPIKLHEINIEEWSKQILSAVNSREAWCC